MHSSDFEGYEDQMAKEAAAIAKQRREQQLMQALLRRMQGMPPGMQPQAGMMQPGPQMPPGMPPFGGPPRA